MTDEQAIEIYNFVCVEMWGGVFTSADAYTIPDKMREIVAAKSDRAAADVIRWWGCWDRKVTATRFARRVREMAREVEG
jgi:hypothetical protein